MKTNLITLTLSVSILSAVAVEQKPNIIMIFADDMGYGDAGCYGYDNLVPTPNIDRLAEQGIRFTQGYVTASACGPSRYGLLTGMYQQKYGVQWNQDTWSDLKNGEAETLADNRIPAGHLMMNQALGRAGYVTGMSGKSNMPCYPKTTFDEYKWVMAFGGQYFPDETGHYAGVDEPVARGGHKRILWGPEREGDVYLTDRLGDHAVDFIERHKQEPFFYYLAFNAPHSPMQAKISHKPQVAHLKTEATRMYGAMLLSMDENIGKVLDKLNELGLSENTIVAFASDNGATFAYNVDWPEDWPKEMLGSVGPLRGKKGTNFEGGNRVPFIIRWPSRLKAGQVYEQPVSTLDLYPTFCAAAEAGVTKETRLDGVDLYPFLAGKESGAPHETLYWFHDDGGAVRHGKWKLLVWKDMRWLYDLDADISESKDLIKQHPEVAAQLEKKYMDFVTPLPPALNQAARK
ncbi:sulfatase family protein [Pontiella sulfatireligans]|uniref:Arylsulfatase n=1 Tax=Pontiella sulfatireligans TaxID=2750658 RepID=A0A6C2UT97_9BACT|nr:sulfatase-like hydrolase/transferase [Pontiella sulfatireligans]SPS74507.1 sulfatase S1_19 [Kiritimatiellales bacterium]VGO22437.1 Arylsulfatase [Pontiella sulfatireligans]